MTDERATGLMDWSNRGRAGDGSAHPPALHLREVPAMPQFTGSVFLPDGSLLASGVQGEYDLDDTDGCMAYSGRFTIPAASTGPLAQDPDPLLLRVDSGPAIHFRMTRMQSGSGRPEATVYFVSHDTPVDDRTT